MSRGGQGHLIHRLSPAKAECLLPPQVERGQTVVLAIEAKFIAQSLPDPGSDQADPG